MNDASFDELARRWSAPWSRRMLLAAAAGVAAVARAGLPSAVTEAAGRCRVVFERCRWDDDCCSGNCNGNRCGKGAHHEDRRTLRVRRRRQQRRERQRRRLEQRRDRIRARSARSGAAEDLPAAPPETLATPGGPR